MNRRRSPLITIWISSLILARQCSRPRRTFCALPFVALFSASRWCDLINKILSRIPQPLFCARSLLIVKFGLLFDGLGFPESRLDALGQVLAGGTADAGDVDVDLAVFADDELYLLHKISTSSGV